MDYKSGIVDVLLATAAAPTYFPVHRSCAEVPLVDGGMFANNPVGLAVVEAIGMLNWPREDIVVLSLGCTTPPFNVRLQKKFSVGQLPWALNISDVFMSGQSSASLGTAQLLIGHEKVIRVTPHVAPGKFALDSSTELANLKGLGASEARKFIPNLCTMFFNEPAEPFIPFRTHVD